MSSPQVTVVSPVFNSADTLRELVDRIDRTLRPADIGYEVVLVDDGSSDDSWRRIEEMAAEMPAVRGIHLAKNYGQHNATLAGIRMARADVVVTLDDDLQHPPEEIPRLLEELEDSGADVVYGSPRRYRQGWFRELASWLSRLALKQTMPAETAKHATGFRAFRTEMRDSFETFDAPLVSIDVVLSWGTGRYSHVMVEHRHRQAGKSNYTIGKLISHGFTMLTGFSVRPLQLASLLGFAFTLAGMGLMAYVVIQRLVSGAAVPGFAFLAATISLFSGIQLFALGTIGEYLARIYQRTIEAPSYVVREVADPEPAE